MGGKKKIRNNIRLKLEERKRQEAKRSNETNPFELRRNKIKHDVLGRKIAKNELGKPLLNRSRAYQKRSQTLLEEYRNQHKSGKGVQDLRELNTDERVVSKYKESQRAINFSHGEEIKLTHKGKPLEDFIDDRLSSDDEDVDLFNREDFVERTHFGGGEDGAPRSSRDVLHDIMQEKHDKRAAKEEAAQLTEQLDSQWKELKSLMKFKGGNPSGPNDTRDEYDSLLSQLIFEGKKPVQEQQETGAPSVTATTTTAAQTADEASASQSPDALLKAKLKQIDTCRDINVIVKLLKESITLLPNVTRKSFDTLKDRLLKLSESSLKFTPKEMALLMLCAYFKELQVLTHLLVLRTLGKLKYTSYHEVAVSLFLNNFLLQTITDKAFYPELFIHVHNLTRLCLPMKKVKLTLFNRLDYETECLLSIQKYGDDPKMAQSPHLAVTPLSLFDRVFADENVDDKIISFSLAMQVVQLAIALFEKYSLVVTTPTMMRPIRGDLQTLTKSSLPHQLKTCIDQLEAKFAQAPEPVIVNRILPKPIILPMLEPRFEEDLYKKDKGDDTKKLTKKFKREMKGAQREIRKDASFLRSTYLKEIEKKDRARRQKVKEILRDLSVQQGLYKKKK